MKKIVILLVALFLTSCLNEGKETVAVNNPNFNVILLFEVDGCKVYRFQDGGRSRYFTNCKGETSWHESAGKMQLWSKI